MDERSRQLLENADALLQRVAVREIPETLWELPQREPERTPQPAPPPPPRSDPVPATMDPEASRAWNAWLNARITTRLEEFAGLLGGEIGKEAKEAKEAAATALELRLAQFKAELYQELLRVLGGGSQDSRAEMIASAMRQPARGRTDA